MAAPSPSVPNIFHDALMVPFFSFPRCNCSFVAVEGFFNKVPFVRLVLAVNFDVWAAFYCRNTTPLRGADFTSRSTAGFNGATPSGVLEKHRESSGKFRYLFSLLQESASN